MKKEKLNWVRKETGGLTALAGDLDDTYLSAETPIGEIIIEKYFAGHCEVRDGWRAYYYPPADEVVESIDIEIHPSCKTEEEVREFVERKIWDTISQIKEIDKDPEWVLVDKLGDAELWENDKKGKEAILIRTEMRVAIGNNFFPGGCLSLGNYYAEDEGLFEFEEDELEKIPKPKPEKKTIPAKIIGRISPEELAERV